MTGLLATYGVMFMAYALWRFVHAIWFPDTISDNSNSAPVDQTSGGDGGVH